jgi:hypothetical protein
MFQQRGVVTHVGPVEKVNDKFTKRGLCIEVEGSQMPQELYLEAANAKVAILDQIKPRDYIQASFYISCRKFMGNDGKVRWYTSLYIAKIDLMKITPMQGLLQEPEAIVPEATLPEATLPEAPATEVPPQA